METKNIIPVTALPLPATITKRLADSFRSYAAVGIDFEIVEVSGTTITVIVTQARLVNGFILNNKELYDRAKEVFKGIDGIKFNIKPSVFSLQVDFITERWIQDRMDEFGIKREDLIKQLALTKSYLSRLFAENESPGKVHLSGPMKATFFYYFLTYELNRDLRAQLN